jgi:DNA-binding transcriptional regulator YhcF (GntR family)
MKIITSLLLLFLITSTGLSWPFGKKEAKPTPTPKQTKVVTPEKPPTLSGGRDLVKQLQKELSEALDSNKKLGVSLENAKKDVETAKIETATVQKKADELEKWGVLQQAEKHKYMKKYDEALVKYHRLKMIAAIIAGAVGVLLGLQFMNFAPPPYNIAVPFGAAGLFALLVWLYF